MASIRFIFVLLLLSTVDIEVLGSPPKGNNATKPRTSSFLPAIVTAGLVAGAVAAAIGDPPLSSGEETDSDVEKRRAERRQRVASHRARRNPQQKLAAKNSKELKTTIKQNTEVILLLFLNNTSVFCLIVVFSSLASFLFTTHLFSSRLYYIYQLLFDVAENLCH